jgi:hypothetical protein
MRLQRVTAWLECSWSTRSYRGRSIRLPKVKVGENELPNVLKGLLCLAEKFAKI